MNFSFKSNLNRLFGDSYFAESKKSIEKSSEKSTIKKEDSTTEFDYEVYPTQIVSALKKVDQNLMKEENKDRLSCIEEV